MMSHYVRLSDRTGLSLWLCVRPPFWAGPDCIHLCSGGSSFLCVPSAHPGWTGWLRHSCNVARNTAVIKRFQRHHDAVFQNCLIRFSNCLPHSLTSLPFWFCGLPVCVSCYTCVSVRPSLRPDRTGQSCCTWKGYV